MAAQVSGHSREGGNPGASPNLDTRLRGYDSALADKGFSQETVQAGLKIVSDNVY